MRTVWEHLSEGGNLVSTDTSSKANERSGVRAERQAETRRRLVEVAREMFLTDGYAATSLDKVAEQAGFSKGAVYSNFSGKEELCLAVLDSIHAEQVDRVAEVFSGPGDLDERIDRFAAWAREGIGQPLWVALESEFGAVARQSPFVASSLRRRHREVRVAITALIEQVTREQGIELRFSPEEAATMMLSFGIGLGALRSIDSDVDPGMFGDVMRTLLRGTRISSSET